MKKNYSITSLLGVTQQDMAMLLRVTRSQWSMYESGKRSLPLPAQQLLADMLVYVQSPIMAGESLPQPEQHKFKIRMKLLRLLRENEYQQVLSSRKIGAATRKQESQLRLLQLAAFLDSRRGNEAEENTIAQNLTYKAARALEAQNAALLVELDIKQELLVLEKILIQSKLRKFMLNINDTEIITI